MGFVIWILVALIAGWLAAQVMKGGGYGVLVDIILGNPRGNCRRLAFRPVGNLAGRRHYRIDHRGICRGGDLSRGYPAHQESLRFCKARTGKGLRSNVIPIRGCGTRQKPVNDAPQPRLHHSIDDH